MYCTHCGKLIDDNATVCPYCNSIETPLQDTQIQSLYDDNLNSTKKIAERIGNVIGKGLGMGINIGLTVTKGIKEGIISEMDRKK